MFDLCRVRGYCYVFLFCLRLSFCWAGLAEETVYLTWQGNPTTSMTVQWITPSRERQSRIVYRPRQEMGDWLERAGEEQPFPQAAPYLLHRVTLDHLQPNTLYTFKVMPYEKEYQFLTAPSELEGELHFVVGGDMYHDAASFMARTCQAAAKTNPLFAVIGGDIAYAVKSVKEEIGRWIEWIKIWHATMVTPAGNLVPVVAAVGNHDVVGQYDQTPAQAAVFSALFPMPGERVYNVLDFSSYLSLFLLDSGHANPIAGKQTEWLKDALNSRQKTLHRFAVYHVPAYPSVRHAQNRQSAAIRTCWVPLFEEGGVQVAFEHHDHAYKRTYPLRQGRIHPLGVVYIGDGAWGVEKSRKPVATRPYLAKSASVRHFVVVTLTPSTQYFRCFTDRSRLIDDYLLQVTLERKRQSVPLPPGKLQELD